MHADGKRRYRRRAMNAAHGIPDAALLPPTHDALEALARDRLDREHFDYYATGAGQERGLGEMVAAWQSWWLRPRVLRDTREVSTATTVLGSPVRSPVLTAPTAVNGLAHPDAEAAVARACARAGTIQVVASGSTLELEEIAAAGGRPWFQLYTRPEWEETVARVHRAEAAGATALVVTVDLPELGLRPRGTAVHLGSDPLVPVQGRLGLANAGLDWAMVERIRALTPLPCVLKGILHPEDARMACEAGIDAIVVSNHGGRQLDGQIPSARALPEVVEVVANRCEVYVDSGIREGLDVLRALALGARAVLVGRPYLWALAVAGEDGVLALLERLREELRHAMVLCGQLDATTVERSVVVPRPG